MMTWTERERLLPFLLGSGGIETYSALVTDLMSLQDEPGLMDILQRFLHNAGKPN
jgi:hypothetical protein